MIYNLLFDTQFKELDKWKFNNCSFDENGYLISSDKIFGIEQELTLSRATKLYLRIAYNTFSTQVNKIYCGIQVGKTLYTNIKHPKQEKEQIISMVEDINNEKIKIQFIFESTEKINKILIKEPILCDLIQMHKSYYLKYLLDKTIKYRFGHSYKNLLNFSEVTPEIFELEKAKIGSIIETKENKKYKIPIELIPDKKYLIKLDYSDINNLGKIFINYGVSKSINIENTQQYLLIKASDKELYLNIEPNDILPYIVNLKHLLIIDLSTSNVDKESIPYLPFV